MTACDANRVSWHLTVTVVSQVLVTGRHGVNAESQMEEMGYSGYSN
jgi:hypothetical protein